MSTPNITGWQRIAIALGIVLVGMALIPYIALPSERFGWQLFAGVYGDGPSLAINYDDGAPGSSFTLTGFSYPANQSLTIKVNGVTLGTVTTDEIGGFQIHITSDANTDEGYYTVTVAVGQSLNSALSATATSAAARFQLSANAPLRAPQGSGASFSLPDGIAQDLIFLPIVTR